MATPKKKTVAKPAARSRKTPVALPPAGAKATAAECLDFHVPQPEALTPLTFKEFQGYIHQKYYSTDSARGIPGTFMWLVEEVGELATALQKQAGEGGETSGHADPAGEFADIIAWLCTLANISGVDLEQALRDKYFKGGGPKGIK